MKKHKHQYDFDGGPCIICGLTVSELLEKNSKMKKADPKVLKHDFEVIKGLPENWYEKMIQEKEEAEEKTRKEEQDRIKKIKCPSCKSTSKTYHEHRNDNGIIGPGYSSWVTDAYYVCNKCGTMFKDMTKIKKR